MIFDKNEYIASATNFTRLKMRKLIPYTFPMFILISCKDEDDNISPRENDFEIEDFIWEGLNIYYYWQNSVPDLADNRFDSQKSYASYLSQFNANHELLFESLLSDKDRFSWIMSDYNALENQLRRVYTTSGMMLGLERIGESNDLFALCSLCASRFGCSRKKHRTWKPFSQYQQRATDNG